MERRAQQVAPLCKHGIERVALVLHPGLFTLDAEAHLAGLRMHAKLVEQGDKVGIGPVIEDDEAGIDRLLPVPVLDEVGMGMPTGMTAGLEHGDIVFTAQMPGGDIAGNTGSDYGDLHSDCHWLDVAFGQCCGMLRSFEVS